MDYTNLHREDFDAVVTGELTHYSLWLENEINGIICDFFIRDDSRVDDFTRLFLHRDGITFQDKLDIVRSMLLLYQEESGAAKLKSLFKEIEDFKSWRNAMAHGLDVSEDVDVPRLRIEIVTRSGKERLIEITPESHVQKISEAEELLQRLREARKHLRLYR